MIRPMAQPHDRLPRAREGAVPVPQAERIRRTRVYEEVAEHLQRQFASGRLKPGDRLPPERELAEQFGVSRTSIRDAIRVLELMGLVEPRQGEGTVVREGSPEHMVAPLATAIAMQRGLVDDLMEVRTVLEPPMSALAASRATPEDVVQMDAIIARQSERVSAGGTAVDEDTAFHYAVATASRNRVVLRVVDVLMDLLRESRARSLQTKGRPERSLAGHRRILEAIHRRDAQGAAAAMRAHLIEIQEILRASGEEES